MDEEVGGRDSRSHVSSDRLLHPIICYLLLPLLSAPLLPFADLSLARARPRKRKERCSGSYRQAVGFLVIKDDSISKRPG